MAKPRVFVSSTYYDLKHIRASLALFIESLGFDSVLSEKGNIAFFPDMSLDESCYREAASADIFVLVIGGRYGSEVSNNKDKKLTRSFLERYESITKKEYESASACDIPVYILIDSNVYSEYQTYLKNRQNKEINYAFVDSANIFRLIEEILSKPRNNPIRAFERFSEIEAWLREQWAGLFLGLLQRRSQQQQLSALSSQVAELREVSATLRRYLESVMMGMSPDAFGVLIQSERKRLEEIEMKEKVRSSNWYNYVRDVSGLTVEAFAEVMGQSRSFRDFARRIERASGKKEVTSLLLDALETTEQAKRDFSEVRTLMGLAQFRSARIADQAQPAAEKRS